MPHTDPHPTPGDLLDSVRRLDAVRVRAEAELLGLACAWADAHPDLDADLDRRPVVPGLGPDWVVDPVDLSDPTVAEHDPDEDPLIPAVDWRAPAAFAAALGLSTQAGETLIREALVLRHRLPQVWARVHALEVPAWRARRIARAVYTRPADVSDHLDAHVSHVAEKVGILTIDRLIDDVPSS